MDNTKKKDRIRVYSAEAELNEAKSAFLDSCEEQVAELIKMGAVVYILTEEPNVGCSSVTAKKYDLLPSESRDNPNVIAEGMHLVSIPKGLRFVSEYKGGPVFIMIYDSGISLMTSGLDQSVTILKSILEEA